MSDLDKLRIKVLDEKSDYALWRIRLNAICCSKGCDLALTTERAADVSDAAAVEKFNKQQKDASSIIVSSLNDAALRVVRSVIGKPVAMIEKLDNRFNSHTTASKISKMSELVSMHYCKVPSDMTMQIDKMAALLEQLRSMKATIDDSMAIGILLASIEVQELAPVVAAIKTLSENNVTWTELLNVS